MPDIALDKAPKARPTLWPITVFTPIFLDH